MENYIGKICPYCKTLFTEKDSVVVCSVCELPHHLSCWQENNGCTTFGCTGIISEIFNGNTSLPKTIPISQKEKNIPQMNDALPQKRFETLFENEPDTIQSNIPILIEKESLIIDHRNNQLMARFIFRSLTEQSISAMLIDVLCSDVWGKETSSVIDFQLLDIKTKRDSTFGQTIPVPIPDLSTRAIQVVIKKVMFDDRSIVDAGTEMSKLPKQVTLEDYFGSTELAQEYVRESNTHAKYAVSQGKDYWRCACGAINKNTDHVCYLCKGELSHFQSLLNTEMIEENLRSFNEEQARKAAQLQAEREEQMRQAEERLRLAEEEKERQKAEAVKKKAKKRKIAIFSVFGVLLTGFLVYATGWHLIPLIRYNMACQALENHSFDEAYSTFVDLGTFKKSDRKAVKTLYQKGLYLMNTGAYLDAAAEFDKIPDYQDSKEQAINCRNEDAYIKASKLFEDGKYQEASEAFTKLSTYKDSSQRAEESVFCLADSYLKAKKYHDAYETFRKVKSAYKDANALKEKINESSYAYAKELFDNKKYQEAVTVYENISSYKDSQDKLKESRYQYALELRSAKSWKEASDLFAKIKGYKKSDSYYQETYYNYGSDLIKSREYTKAISVFKSLNDYKESKSKINEAKYGYVTSHKSSSDYSTYDYLKDLIAVGYKDSQSIYNDLYQWKITNVYFNKSKSSTLKSSAINKYSPVYCHFTLSGGPPDGETTVYYYITFPDGDQKSSSMDDKMWDGCKGGFYWENGIYDNALYGVGGKLSVSFYDENSNYIGSGSVDLY